MDTPYQSAEDVIWERADPGRRASVAPLNRDDVVRAAIGLADADGMVAVSVRRVATALDVGPMRLYRVFDTVDELTELMVDAIYGEVVTAVTPRGAWRTRARTILVQARATFVEHEWVADLLGTRPHLGPNGLAWLELLASSLWRAPAVHDADDAWTALGAVNGFLVGAVRREIADRRAGRTGAGLPQWQQQMAPYLGRMLATGRFPTIGELITERGDPEPEAAFRAEVDLVLAGLATR